MTKTEQLRFEYRTAFWEYLRKQGAALKGSKPSWQYWLSFALGHSDTSLYAEMGAQKQYIGAGIGCYGPNAKVIYRLLHQQKDEIEKELGFQLYWDERPDRKQSYIELWKDADPTNREQWPEQHEWLKRKLEALHQAFSRRVKVLEIAPKGIESVGSDVE